MEPSDFDQLIKDKLANDNSIHAHEIEKAKPFIWTAIQNNIYKGTVVFPWYQVAAALVLLIICSSFLFYSLQLNHQTEITKLNTKVESLKSYYDQQAHVIIQKNDALLNICNEVDHLELLVNDLTEETTTNNVPRELLVFKSDTIFVDRVEYITQIIQSKDSLNNSDILNEELVEEQEEESTEKSESAQQIYPNYNKIKVKPAESELLKFKISAYSF